MKNSFLEIIWNPIALIEVTLCKELEKLIKGSIISDTDKWVDVGCGERPYEAFFPNKTYIGVDVETSGRDKHLKNPDYFYDGKILPFEENSIDGVLSTQVLEHVLSPEQYLKEIYRVLKPGGKLIISTPFVWQEHEIPYDFIRWTSFGIKHDLQNCGFQKIKNIKINKSIEASAMIFNMYILHNLKPPIRGFGRLLCFLVCFPIQFFALVLQRLLPDKGLFYINNITVAEK
jgi:SAM-dependent methyltransferase